MIRHLHSSCIPNYQQPQLAWNRSLFMHRRPESRRSHLPPTGSSPDRGGAGTASVVRDAGPMAPGGGADRGSRRRMRAPGMPRCRRRPWPVSGPGPRKWARVSGAWLPSGGRAPGTSRPGRRLRFNSPGHGRTSLPGTTAPYPGYHAELCGWSWRTRAEPPLWVARVGSVLCANGVQNGEFCALVQAKLTGLAPLSSRFVMVLASGAIRHRPRRRLSTSGAGQSADDDSAISMGTLARMAQMEYKCSIPGASGNRRQWRRRHLGGCLGGRCPTAGSRRGLRWRGSCRRG